MIPLEILQGMANRYPYHLLFATISGAHLYGFASPDSDWDLRGCHVMPLEEVLSLNEPEETVERSGWEEGLDMDLVTHDAHKFFRLMLKKNGYVLEQLLSPLIVHTTAYHQELISLVPGCITRHHAHHYLGFAETQKTLFLKENPPRIKPLLYLYRVLLTGIHLMRTGQIEANLNHLNDPAKMPFLTDLIQLKSNGKEKTKLDKPDIEFHLKEVDRLREELLLAFANSHLPESPRAKPALNDLLVRIRLGKP